jgi:hypothetical protein
MEKALNRNLNLMVFSESGASQHQTVRPILSLVPSTLVCYSQRHGHISHQKTMMSQAQFSSEVTTRLRLMER